MAKQKSTWKSHERRTAKMLGGHRVGPTGLNSEDVSHPWLSIECKHRKLLPSWLKDAVNQAKINRSCETKLPIAVLHELNSRSANDLVVMKMSDFIDWFGG